MKSISLVLAFVALAGLVSSAPAPAAAPASRSPRVTHPNFGPALRKTYSTQPAQLLDATTLASTDPIQIAILHASLESGSLPLESIRVSSSHVNRRNGVTHVYLQQVLHGMDIINGVANVNVDEGHRVVSTGNSFFKGVATVQPPAAGFATKFSPSDAVAAFATFLGKNSIQSSALQVSPVSKANGVPSFSISGAAFAANPITADLKYIQIDSGRSVRLAFELLVEIVGSDNVYDAVVDAETGEILYLLDLVSDLAQYNVYPLGINDPDSGDRQLLVDPAHPVASPFGWHSQGILGRNFTDTQGNNVHSQDNPRSDEEYENKYRPDGGQALNFDFPLDLTKEPNEYLDAAITNLFYWSNTAHDLYYVYGFDEASGNFQHNNFNNGGQGNDPVITFAQDGGGYNNANFYTPRDGSQGIMRMYIWNANTPNRDGDLDGGIVFHEYTHGLSNRLTGGPENSGCLGWYEAGGMGEGWSDIVATVTRTTATSTHNDNYNMGGYAAGNDRGIRNYVYSTDMTTNPSTYAFLDRSGYAGVHAIGEVWAVILYDVYWNLVDEFGFESNWFNTRSPAGNTVFLQLLIDGMKLQPCDPNFVDARNAILQADELDYGGWHKCNLWRGFAKRGLGFSARGGTGGSWNGEEAFDVPAECQA